MSADGTARARTGRGASDCRRSCRPLLAAIALVAALPLASCARSDVAQEPASLQPDQLRPELIRLGGAPWGVVVEGDAVWVSDTSAATVRRLDPGNGEGREVRPVGTADPRSAGLALGDGRLWVANLGGSVTVLDVSGRGERGVEISVGPGEPAAVTLAGSSAWVPLHGPGGGLVEVDVETLTVLRRVELVENAFAVAVDDKKLWVAGLERRLFAVDRSSGRTVRTIDLGAAPRGVALGDGAVWVTLRDEGVVARVDPVTGEVVARIDVGGQPWPVAVGAGAVWVADLDGRFLRIDPRTNVVSGVGRVGPQPRTIAVGRGAVWVASQDGTVARLTVG